MEFDGHHYSPVLVCPMHRGADGMLNCRAASDDTGSCCKMVETLVVASAGMVSWMDRAYRAFGLRIQD